MMRHRDTLSEMKWAQLAQLEAAKDGNILNPSLI